MEKKCKFLWVKIHDSLKLKSVIQLGLRFVKNILIFQHLFDVFERRKDKVFAIFLSLELFN